MTVDQIYNLISTLAVTTESAYIANEEFNRVANLAQDNLLEYYTKDLGQAHTSLDSLIPFIVTNTLTGSGGIYDAPADFRNDLREGLYEEIENSSVKEESR